MKKCTSGERKSCTLEACRACRMKCHRFSNKQQKCRNITMSKRCPHCLVKW